MSGGKLVFEMGAQPNKEWASAVEDRPKSKIEDYLIQAVPFIKAASITFTDSMKIELGSPILGARIYYSLDGSNPDSTSQEYLAPFTIHKSMRLNVISYAKDLPTSKTISTEFIKIEQNQKIELLSKYSNQYTAGGNQALIDFIEGGDDFRDGTWQGYEAQDFVAIVDLGERKPIYSISTGFLQSISSWIWLPKQVEYFVSDDGTNFQSVGIVKSTLAENDYENIKRNFSLKLNNVYARYVKVKATNYGTIPDWHLGAGGQAWIFVDEIRIE